MTRTDEELLTSIEEGLKDPIIRTNLFLRSARRLYELVGDEESVVRLDERQAAEPNRVILAQFSPGTLRQLVRRARERCLMKLQTTEENK